MKKVYLKDLTPEEIVKRLKSGEVIKTDGINTVHYMVDNIIVSKKGKGFWICNTLCTTDDCYYFEEEEPFEITETGLYKTRDGRKAFVYLIDDDDTFPISYSVDGNSVQYVATKQGLNTPDKELSVDLVSKWEE